MLCSPLLIAIYFITKEDTITNGGCVMLFYFLVWPELMTLC